MGEAGPGPSAVARRMQPLAPLRMPCKDASNGTLRIPERPLHTLRRKEKAGRDVRLGWVAPGRKGG